MPTSAVRDLDSLNNEMTTDRLSRKKKEKKRKEKRNVAVKDFALSRSSLKSLGRKMRNVSQIFRGVPERCANLLRFY